MLGFKSFGNAATTLAGIELAQRIHERQFSFGPGRQWRNQSLKQLWTGLSFQLDFEIRAAKWPAFSCRQCTRTKNSRF